MDRTEGTPQNVHLRRIEPDQSIQGIETIDDTQRNDAGRKWFVSQAIQPVAITATYDAATGRFELGGAQAGFTATMTFDTTSQAAYTLTVPANRKYKLVAITYQNATRAPTMSMGIVMGGVTSALFGDSAAGSGTVSRTVPLVGGVGDATYAATCVGGPLWLEPGAVVTVTCTNFVAADDTECTFFFESYGA